MMHSTFGQFQGTPALYASLPPRQRQRRTATGIMAGLFDPLPALAYDSGRDDSSSSHESTMSGVWEDEVAPEGVLAGSGRGKNTSRKSALSEERKGVAVKRVSEAIFGKGKQVRRVMPEEKENAMSDGDTSVSLSPISPIPLVAVAPPTSEPCGNMPKASGFWRARSSNTPAGESSTTLKRKRSLFKDDSSSPAPENPPAKKSRSSEAHLPLPIAAVPSPSSDSLTSLDGDSRDPAPEKTYEEKLTEAVFPHTYPYGDKHPHWVRCQRCDKVFESRHYIEKHFTNKHPEIVAHLEDFNNVSQVPPRKKRPRKNVAVKKGWKGWVEEDLEPQKLILLDKPEVLPERTTRSGRKID